MSFELDGPRRREPTINISALIDVVFILMIFVILGASFERLRALGIQLPQGDSTDAPRSEPIMIVISAEESPLVDGVVVPMHRLREHLETRRSESDAVVIQADRTLPLQRVIDLLDAARAAGFTAVSVATQPRPVAQ